MIAALLMRTYETFRWVYHIRNLSSVAVNMSATHMDRFGVRIHFRSGLAGGIKRGKIKDKWA